VPQPPQGAPTWQEIPRADMPTTGDLRNLSNPTVPPPPNPMEEQATGAANDEAMQRTAKQGELDAASKRKVEEEKAAHPQRDYVGEIKARSEATSKAEAERHKAKMEEIDETAKVKAAHATSAHKSVASDEDKFQKALEKSDYIAAKKSVTKAEDDYDAAIDRQKTMHQNLEDGLKGNQQAMLSLVANHIGMTLGAQKGARITRAVWDEATSSTPWLQKLEAKFDDRGYLSGVTLTPDQMNQMVGLADQKVGILKDHTDRLRDRYKDALAVKGRGRGSTVSAPPSGESQRFSVNGRTYNIPAEHVAEFKRDHPDATSASSR
jgi:hypothetical protein